MGSVTLSLPEAYDLALEVLSANGFSADHAAAIARNVTAGERDGCASHGLWRLLGIVDTLRKGKVSPDAEPQIHDQAPGIARADAGGAFSLLAYERALPLLLEKYYSEIHDANGNLSRISIITTNSCTNIKTYANLKYMNQVYLRDQFLMIRDGDGKNPEELAGQLCRYYDERSLEDVDKLPKVTRRNVLILKYYSFENYFLNPKIMAELGIVKSEEAFYETLFSKWQEYLYRLQSGRHLTEVLGGTISSVEELKAHMEEFKIYMRGHNLYDIFYGPYKKRETEILRKYMELAPREDFKDILEAIDRFVYFDSRKVDT